MFSPLGVIFIGIGFVCACLISIYLYAIRINSRCSSNIEKLNAQSEQLYKTSNNESAKSKKKPNSKSSKTKIKRNVKNSDNVQIDQVDNSLIPATPPSQSIVSHDYDEDIIALASLKGYDISNIKCRKNVSLSEKSNTNDYSDSNLHRKFVAKSDIVVNESISMNFDDIVTENEQTTVSESLEWSSIPTREEETLKSLKNKISNLQSDLEESNLKNIRSASQLEQAQKRISLLERELLEQSKVTNSIKLSYETQINSLRAVNYEIMSKLAVIETDNLNASVLKKELDRSKDTVSLLQTEVFHLQEEKCEIQRQLVESKNENSLLRERSYLVETLNEKCMKLEEKLGETHREMSLQAENFQTELQLTKAKLEGEIAFHRAEHANSVGSSTALHQEIFQLKSELNQMIDQDSQAQIRIHELEGLNSQLLQKIEDQNALNSEIERAKNDLQISEAKVFEIKTLLLKANDELTIQMNEKFDLENNIKLISTELNSAEEKVLALTNEVLALQTEISAKNSQISDLNEKKDNFELAEIESLREKLAEYQIKISSLQSDLNREIKRADVSKKVYEAKLAELERIKN